MGSYAKYKNQLTKKKHFYDLILEPDSLTFSDLLKYLPKVIMDPTVNTKHIDKLLMCYLSQEIDWISYKFFGEKEPFTRNVIEMTEDYVIFITCWKTGACLLKLDTSCAFTYFKVLEGTLEDRYYDNNNKESMDIVYERNSIGFYHGIEKNHSLHNISKNKPSVSLHVFSPYLLYDIKNINKIHLRQIVFDMFNEFNYFSKAGREIKKAVKLRSNKETTKMDTTTVTATTQSQL